MSARERKVGAALSLVGLTINAALALAYVPLLLRVFSVSEYGIYELGATVIAYLAMADFGLSAAVSRFYAVARSRGGAGLPNLVATTLVLYAILTLVLAGALLALVLNAETLFGQSMSTRELDLTRQVLSLVTINVLFSLPNSWFNGILVAGEKFIFLRSVAIVRAIVQFVVVAVVLVLSGSVFAVIAMQVAVSALVLATSAWYAVFKARLPISVGRWEAVVAREVTGFTVLLAVVVAFDLVFWRTGQFVLGAVSGTAAVASYAISVRLVTAVFMPLSTSISGVFLPRLAASEGSNEPGSVDELFIKVGRAQALLVWGALGAFAVLGREFIHLWAGPDFDDVYLGALLLMCGLSVSSVQSLGNVVLQARNRMRFRAGLFFVMFAAFALAAPNVATNYGVLGICGLGAGLLIVGTGPIMNLYYHFGIGIDIPRFVRSMWPALVPVAVASSVSILVSLALTRAPSWTGLCLTAMLYGLCYAGIAWLTVLHQSERDAVRVGVTTVIGFVRREI